MNKCMGLPGAVDALADQDWAVSDTWNVGRANPQPGIHVYTSWLPAPLNYYETLVIGPNELLQTLNMPHFDAAHYASRDAAQDGHRHWLGKVETWLERGEW
jgi:hypothetical protein